MPLDFNLRLILPELVVAITGFVLLALDAWSTDDKRRVGRAGLVGILLALASVFLVFGQSGEAWSRMVAVDGFSNFFRIVFLTITALVLLTSFQYVEKRRMPAGEFYVLLVFATVGMMFMASSFNLLTIYIGLEILSLAAYALSGLLRSDPRSSEAAIKYVLIGGITSAVIVFGMSIVYGTTGSLHLGDIAQALAGQAAVPPALLAGIIFLIAGFGVKIAAVPFHMWAPDIYHGAPTPVSAFLITASEGAAFAALIRIFLVGFPSLEAQWTTLFAILAVITMTLGNVAAITQTEVKRMMAYSAIAQAGYLLVGLAVGTPVAISAMLYYLFAYALMTIGAFAVIILMNNAQDAELISDFRGLARRSPWVAFALMVYMLSLIGVPPTAGFFGKLFLIRATLGEQMAWLAIVLGLNSAVSIPYYFSLIRNMYLGEADTTQPVKAPPTLRWALGLTVAATLLLGLFPETMVFWVNQITSYAAGVGLASLLP